MCYEASVDVVVTLGWRTFDKGQQYGSSTGLVDMLLCLPLILRFEVEVCYKRRKLRGYIGD